MLGTVVETGYCYLNAQRTFQEPAIWEQGCQKARKQRDNSEMYQVCGKKVKMSNYPPLPVL